MNIESIANWACYPNYSFIPLQILMEVTESEQHGMQMSNEYIFSSPGTKCQVRYCEGAASGVVRRQQLEIASPLKLLVRF